MTAKYRKESAKPRRAIYVRLESLDSESMARVVALAAKERRTLADWVRGLILKELAK